MTAIVVGGHSRNTGKTTVAEGLIRALSGCVWTAIKISSHWHAGNGPPEDPNHGPLCSILEEMDRKGNSDTSRFLAAGAARSLWVQVRENGLAEAMEKLRPILQSSPFVIIESNAILRFFRPDLYIMVLRYDVEDFKDSARELLGQADAVVAIGRGSLSPSWEGMAKEALAGVPMFAAADPKVLPGEFIEWVRARLRGSAGAHSGTIHNLPQGSEG
jgi:hypothetical protein